MTWESNKYGVHSVENPLFKKMLTRSTKKAHGVKGGKIKQTKTRLLLGYGTIKPLITKTMNFLSPTD